jgi:hypothetical protein
MDIVGRQQRQPVHLRQFGKKVVVLVVGGVPVVDQLNDDPVVPE